MTGHAIASLLEAGLTKTMEVEEEIVQTPTVTNTIDPKDNKKRGGFRMKSGGMMNKLRSAAANVAQSVESTASKMAKQKNGSKSCKAKIFNLMDQAIAMKERTYFNERYKRN